MRKTTKTKYAHNSFTYNNNYKLIKNQFDTVLVYTILIVRLRAFYLHKRADPTCSELRR